MYFWSVFVQNKAQKWNNQVYFMSKISYSWVWGHSEAQKMYFLIIFEGWSTDCYEEGLNLF